MDEDAALADLTGSWAIESLTFTPEALLLIRSVLSQTGSADAAITQWWHQQGRPRPAPDGRVGYLAPVDEAALTGIRLAARLIQPPGPWTIQAWRALHAQLFRDGYRWAGTFRTVDLSKGSTLFARPAYVIPEAHRILQAMQCPPVSRTPVAIARQLAVFHTDLNRLHPFCDGNGRTQRELLRPWAQRAGYRLAYAFLDPVTY
jgi:fido (protein-threonine AMPylation protein)